ncbi:MAG TPA: sulfotransferase domain-containing protein [Caulobacteraceae bacterium]|nr:sulfotransferase domain-containing protein [Caulobacteraceae bacterium]
MPELLRAPERRVLSPVTDSARWEHFSPRDGDIVIATYAKCGTTWMQRIVDLLVFASPEVRPVSDLAPWFDSTIFNPLEEDLATLEAQRHRRFVKSHLPFDALPVWDGVSYIHVGRDGRDARLSWKNHQQGMTPEFVGRVVANAMAIAQAGGDPGGPPPPPAEDPRQYLLDWMDGLERDARDANLGDHFFEFEATYWRERARKNLLLVHYDDLNRDLEGEMRRIADFLSIDIEPAVMSELARAASFAAMKKDGEALIPGIGRAFDRGAERFINQGRSGRWREVLSEEDAQRYAAIARRSASPGLAAWLERGRQGGDPRAAAD